MKILLFNYGFPPDQTGGAETYTEQVARAFLKRGHSVRVICGQSVESRSNGFFVKDEDYDGLQVSRISFSHQDSARYRIFPQLYEWSLRWIEQVRPDVVYAGMFWYLLAVLKAAEKKKIPSILIAHGYDLFCMRCNLMTASGELCSPPVEKEICRECALGYHFGGAPFFIRLPLLKGLMHMLSSLTRSDRLKSFSTRFQSISEMESSRKWLVQYVSAIVCPSRFCLERHQRVLNNYKNLIHIPNGIDCARFAHIPPVTERNKIVFAYFGRIDPYKGIETAIEAFQQIPQEIDAEFRIYGDLDHPWYRDYARNIMDIAKGNKRIGFRGVVKGQDLLNAYRDMSVMILPTVTENLSITIQEALASQRPVICSTVGGNTEMIINNVNGLTFPPGDVNALHMAMMRIIKEQGLLSRLASNAKPYRDIHDSAIELEKLFEKVIANRR